jgi:hypothetical protein
MDSKVFCAKREVHFEGMTQLFLSGNSEFPHERPEMPVLAWLCRRSFARARKAPGFSLWRSYREFVHERDALYVGFGAAGVTARLQRVPFDAFERWARLTGAQVNVDGLDEFARHWRWRVRHPDAPVCGRFGVPDDPERNAIDAAGAQCVRIRPEVFVRWRDDYAKANLFAPPTLDDYATRVVECCFVSSRRARRPAVNSA